MKQPSVYLKMRVLGAVDTVEGRTRHERVRHVAAMTFVDEEGHPGRFTWRTIQTWYYLPMPVTIAALGREGPPSKIASASWRRPSITTNSSTPNLGFKTFGSGG